MPAYRHVMREARRIVCDRRWKGLLLASTAIVSANVLVNGEVRAQAGGGQTQSAPNQFTFNIPPQSLTSAMIAFQGVTGISVLADGSVPQEAVSPGVSGALSADGALSQMLAGTGLSYSISGSTARIFDPSANDAGATVDGAIALDTIDVSGGAGVDGTMTPDTPYETAGSVSHISREQMDRVPPVSPGDMFVATPGVLNGGNRVGTSLNPNIRGLQGMGRVNTTVDGAINSTTSYRGYAGTRDETYVDPDMIGGIDITKGPSDGPNSAIGGTINMRTLAAQDIVKGGEQWAARFKGSLSGNNLTPFYKPPGLGPEVTRDADRPGFFDGDGWSGSMAVATSQQNFDGVFALSRRKQGNYFAGENNVPDGFVFGNVAGRNARVSPGDEVYNTSEETDSLLAKGKFKWGDGQSLELGYMLFDSLAGEEDEPQLGLNYGQRNLSRTEVDTYTARYRYAPSDNRLVNLRANLWHTDLEHTRDIGWTYVGRNHSMATTGADISNRSVIATAFGQMTLDAGGELRHEAAFATETNERWLESRGPNGVRNLASVFGKTTVEPTSWLELSAGARFDHYTAEGKRIAAIHPDREEQRLSPNAGVVVKPLDGLQLFAQYTEGFRAPSLRELYWEFRTALLRVNPNLQGEVSKNAEFGLNVLRDNVLTDGDKARFKASYFRNRYDDFILYALVPGGGPFTGPYEFINIDRANYHGVELSGSYDTGIFFAEGAFTKYLKAEYCTVQSGCRMPSFGEIISNVTPPTYVPPEWSGSVTAGVRLFDESLTLGARAIFSSTRIGTNWPPTTSGGLIGFQHTWPEFVVFDLFGSYKLSEKTMLNFSVENVTDQYYYGPLSTTAMPSPGRTARVGFTHTFGE